MTKTVIKTCSCFLDVPLLFVKYHDSLLDWKYAANCYSIRKKKEIFILREKETFYTVEFSNEFVSHRVVISCCVDCLKFQTVLKTCFWQKLNGVKCRNTVGDKFTFDSGYQEEILVGNLPNEFHEMNDESESECEKTITFTKQPFKKCCFTDSKLDHNRFCSECQETFRKMFEPDLFAFSRKMSTVNEIKSKQIYLLCHITEPKENFQIKEIRVCECFLDRVLFFMEKLVKERDVEDVFKETL